MTKLSLASVGDLNAGVSVPRYSRSSLRAGIVHFGVGNFHRAHLGVYLDDLFNMGLNHDWAIIGAGVMPSDDLMRQKLAAQDYLTTVVEQEASRTAARVTGPMIDFIPTDDRKRLVETMTAPAIRIVSLTVTEGGLPRKVAGHVCPGLLSWTLSFKGLPLQNLFSRILNKMKNYTCVSQLPIT